MKQSNFSRLVSQIKIEIRQRDIQNSPAFYLSQYDGTHSRNRATMAKAISASRSLSKRLTPTKAEIKMKNQKKMRQVRQSIKDAILTKSLSCLEVIKLENSANKLQAQLYQRGLI